MTTNDTSRIGLQRQIDTLRLKIKALEKGNKPKTVIFAVSENVLDRISGLENEIAELKDHVAVLNDIAHNRVRPADTPDLQRDFESLTAYVKRLETDSASASRVERIAEELGELRDRFDGALAQGASEMLDLKDRIERTANKIYDVIWNLEQRISDCELAVGTDKLDGAPPPNIPTNDPEPPVDTSWHPYDVLVDGVIHDHPHGDKRVVAMTRSGLIDGPFTAQHAHWDERGVMTIVAWRYAKAGE